MYWKLSAREQFDDDSGGTGIVDSGKEAEIYLNSRYPASQFSLAALDPVIANRLTQTFQDLFDMYPHCRIRTVEISHKVRRQVFADYDETTDVLRLGRDFEDAAGLEATLLGESRARWHPEGAFAPEAIVVHEFGHSVYYKAPGAKDFAKEYFDRAWEVSDYAEEDEGEFFAEVFTEYYFGDPAGSSLELLMQAWLHNHLNEI